MFHEAFVGQNNVNVPDDACPDTHHVERHDDHEVDADAGARGGELPVLLHKIPLDSSKLLHCEDTENHHGKHGGQDEGYLSRDDGEKRMLYACV